jgi:cytochrome c biogenesis protein CcmG/thiol:disulfide interchange protein DsbE
LQPRSNLPPKPNMSPCPRCLKPRNPSDIICTNCGLRSCPKGHIIHFRVCPQCGWEDDNFRQQSRTSIPGGAYTKASEITTHRIEYKCPLCHAPVEDKYARCPNRECNYLGPHVYRGVEDKTLDRTPNVATPAPRQSSVQGINQPVFAGSATPQQDAGSNDWTKKQNTLPPENMPPVQEKRDTISQRWQYTGKNTRPSLLIPSKKQVLVAARVVVLVIFVAAIVFTIMINTGNIQTAISALTKLDLPKPSAPQTPAITDIPPPAVSSIQVSEVTASSVVITWITDKIATSQIEYGTTTAYGSTTPQDENLVTSHKVKLNGLNPATSYHYRIRYKDTLGNLSMSSIDGTFVTTAPPPPVVSGIKVADVSDTTVTITWVTDVKTTGQLEYGTTTAYGSTTSVEEKLSLDHRITLNGLEPDKSYNFRIKSQDASKNETISEVSQPFKTLAPVPTGLEVGKRAPDFTVYTLDGASVTLSKLRGKIVMVNFWALGCGACIAEMPDIEAIYNIYKNKPLSGTKELNILAINVSDYPESIQKAIAEEKWTLPIFVDSDRDAVSRYQIRSIPRTFFIDSSGIIRNIGFGRFDTQDEIKEALNSLQ